MADLVDRFCTSRDRARLLKGLNHYRKHLFQGGFVSGFQWIDGSFVENVENLRNRSPKDIDVVTLHNRPLRYQGNPQQWERDFQTSIWAEYFDPVKLKASFNCDGYNIDLDAKPSALIRSATYWFGLFTDMRGTNQKKGIVEIPLPHDNMEFQAIDLAIGAKFNV